MFCSQWFSSHANEAPDGLPRQAWNAHTTECTEIGFELEFRENAGRSVLSRRQVRSNVDPNGDYTDDEIWIALGKARLEEKVRGLPGDLGYAGKTERAALFSAVCFTEMIVLSR